MLARFPSACASKHHSKHSLWASCFIACVLLTGCCHIGTHDPTPFNALVASDHGSLNFVIEIPPGGFQSGRNDFVIRVLNPDQSPGVLFQLRASMPRHGHTAPLPTLVDQGEGRFRVTDLLLDMQGEWMMELTLSRTGAFDDDHATVWAWTDGPV